ncbi:MAG: hypothetical protein LUF33_03580 [Clostridiales bacterium]|nr:hypothetical protein [Clostridiales bacterium]
MMNFFWISLFLTFLIFLADGIHILKTGFKNKIDIIGKATISIISVLMILNIFFGVNYFKAVSPYSLTGDDDYISSEYFRGISLDELEKDLNAETPVLIYIGRNDCDECLKFEEAIEPELEEYCVELPTYYTNKDRNGDKSNEMYELFDSYAIEGVPIVILAQESQILKMWNNPTDEIEEIVEYL